MAKVLDTVALSEALPEHRLEQGQVGTIVEALAKDVFEVEFVDHSGHTYAMLPLHKTQFIVLRYELVA
jgi:ribosomal 30S subunit maturation factor RimM